MFKREALGAVAPQVSERDPRMKSREGKGSLILSCFGHWDRCFQSAPKLSHGRQETHAAFTLFQRTRILPSETPCLLTQHCLPRGPLHTGLTRGAGIEKASFEERPMATNVPACLCPACPEPWMQAGNRGTVLEKPGITPTGWGRHLLFLLIQGHLCPLLSFIPNPLCPAESIDWEGLLVMLKGEHQLALQT